jgi:hypothetical protein
MDSNNKKTFLNEINLKNKTQLINLVSNQKAVSVAREENFEQARE